MQLILQDNDKFFRQLRDWRRQLRPRAKDAPPLGLGWRIAQSARPDDYVLMVYRKGAWVLQMLRNMMLDFRTTNEDAFFDMMQDYYRRYRGKRASTRDFQRVVERHTGVPMQWFFNEWVSGTAIPTYTPSSRTEQQPDGKYLLHLRMRQEQVPEDFVMPDPVRLQFADGTNAVVRLVVRGRVTESTVGVPSPPSALEPNPLESVLAEMKTEDWQ